MICRQGTANAPITVRGVPNANGELPVIDGNGAVTPINLNFRSEQRGVIKIGSANIPADTMPKYITIENLEIRSAHPIINLRTTAEIRRTYSSAASSDLSSKKAKTSRSATTSARQRERIFRRIGRRTRSRNILVEGNYIFDNGIVGSAFQHNNYTAAIGIMFQYNRFGPLGNGRERQ